MKKVIGSILVAVLFLFFAACNSDVFSADSLAEAVGTTTATPSAVSRSVRGEPVTVTETYAKVDAIGGAATPTPNAEVYSVSDAVSATPTPAAEQSYSVAEATDTPSTGDSPVLFLSVALGLILFCSAGLLMLRRI